MQVGQRPGEQARDQDDQRRRPPHGLIMLLRKPASGESVGRPAGARRRTARRLLLDVAWPRSRSLNQFSSPPGCLRASRAGSGKAFAVAAEQQVDAVLVPG